MRGAAAGLWVKTSLKQTELNLGQQNGLCLGWLLYTWARTRP